MLRKANWRAHAATRRLLEVEEQAIHHFQHQFKEGLAQDEQAYRANVQHAARLCSQSLQQKLQYHMNAQAQTESLPTAERQGNAQKTLEDASHPVGSCSSPSHRDGEEAVEQERLTL